MKAFLLAAGLGTRLRPLTDVIPKCLIEINGRPLLDWWLKLLAKHNITEVLINLHHFPDLVIKHLASANTNIKFKYYFEEKLIGSGGTLRENKDFVKGEKYFFIFYADNLTNCNITNFLEFHQKFNCPFTMGLFRTENPTTKGIAEINQENLIISFEEKPKNPKSNLANAGLYIAEPSILELIPNQNFTDIGYHLLPQLINNMNGWFINDYIIDIGTHNDLKKAKTEWQKIEKRNNSNAF